MTNSQSSVEPFLGVWELDPTQSNYEFGTPPQRGRYELAREGDALAVIMDWTDAAGKDFHMVYHMHPDGVEHPYTDSPAVDAIVTTLVNAHTLDTVSKKDGAPIAVGRRALSKDGRTMFITQSGKMPDGKPYNNYSVYHKV